MNYEFLIFLFMVAIPIDIIIIIILFLSQDIYPVIIGFQYIGLTTIHLGLVFLFYTLCQRHTETNYINTILTIGNIIALSAGMFFLYFLVADNFLGN